MSNDMLDILRGAEMRLRERHAKFRQRGDISALTREMDGLVFRGAIDAVQAIREELEDATAAKTDEAK